MIMSKKWRSFLVLGMIVMVAFACNTQAAKVKIIVWNWGQSAIHQKNYDDILKAYPELAKKMEVEVRIAGKQDSDSAQKFRLALSANEGLPDIMSVNFTQLPEFAEAGVLENLSSAFRKYKDDLTPAALNLATYKNKYYLFPYQVKTKLWYYRQDIFKEVGIDPNQVKTVDDFIAAGKKLQTKYPNSYMINIGPQSIHYLMWHFVSGYNGRFNDKKGNYIISKDPGVRKAFMAIKKIKDSGVALPVNDFTPEWNKSFADGSLVSLPISNWMKAFLPRYVPDQAGKWAATSWPEEIAFGDSNGGSGEVIPKGSKNKKLAIELLTISRLERKAQVIIYNNTGHYPCSKSGLADPEVQKPNAFFGENYAAAEAMGFKYYRMYPYTPNSMKEQPIVMQWLDAYLNNQKTLDEVLKGCEADLRNQIGNAYRL